MNEPLSVSQLQRALDIFMRQFGVDDFLAWSRAKLDAVHQEEAKTRLSTFIEQANRGLKKKEDWNKRFSACVDFVKLEAEIVEEQRKFEAEEGD